MIAIDQKPRQCFYPDGSAADNSHYTPCNSNAGSRASMCCRDAYESFPNLCGSDGLCQERLDTSVVWRESCTDPTWQAPECLQICVDGDNAMAGMALTFCSDGSLCCGRKNDACCAAGRGVWRVGNTTTNTKPISSSTSVFPSPSSALPPSSSALSTALPGSTATLGTNSPAPPVDSHPLPGEALVGIVIGVVFFVGALLLYCSYYYVKERKARHIAAVQKYGQLSLSGDTDAWRRRTERATHQNRGSRGNRY